MTADSSDFLRGRSVLSEPAKGGLPQAVGDAAGGKASAFHRGLDHVRERPQWPAFGVGDDMGHPDNGTGLKRSRQRRVYRDQELVCRSFARLVLGDADSAI